MSQGNVSQKALGISGVILAILVMIGWYLYGAQKNSLQSLVDESQAMGQKLSEALDQSKNEIDSLSLSIQKLTGDLSAVQVSLTDEQRLRIELQADLAQTHSDKKQIEQSMRDKVKSITASSSELEKELQRQLSLQEKLNNEIDLISDEKGELLARIENEQENQLRLQQQIDRVKDDVGQKESALATAEQEAARLNMQLSQTREERVQLENRVEKLNQQIDRVMDDVGQKETALANAEQEAARLNMQLSQSREERVQLENTVETLNQQIRRVKDDVGQKETALANAVQEAARLSMQLTQAREEQALLETRVETLNQQREIDARHFADLEDRLKRELNESRIEISQFKNQMTVIKLTSEVLFHSGSAKIQPGGQKVLAVIAESLNAYPDRAISIEGHTDNVPMGKKSRYASNWELSTGRALAAVNFFQQNNQMDPQRLQVVGHGEFQPVSSNETVEGRQQNRRIEIRLMPESQVSAEQ